VSWSHVSVLIRFAPRERARWQKAIAAEGWKGWQFRRELRAKVPRDPRGGGPFAGAKDAIGCTQRLAELTERWLRYYQEVLGGEDCPLTRIDQFQATASLAKDLDEAKKAVRELGRHSKTVEVQLAKAAKAVQSKQRRKGSKRRSQQR
jgi:hypothetical protein